MKVTISVTQEDIEEGEPEQGDSCPIALAARRVLPGLPALYVGSGDLYREQPPIFEAGPVLARLPQEARDFICAFDEACPRGDGCDYDDCMLSHTMAYGPFAFELDVPEDIAPAVTQ